VSDMVGSTKQKEHKPTGSSPPSQPSRDKVSTTSAGSQAATWKDKVNPFKRHGSGSTLSSADQTASSSAQPTVTGVFGVPLHLCEPGVNNKVRNDYVEFVDIDCMVTTRLVKSEFKSCQGKNEKKEKLG